MQVEIDADITELSTPYKAFRSFNSYIIRGEKYIALVDSAALEFEDFYIRDLSEAVDISEVDYFIYTHTDPWRAGMADRLTKLNPNAKVCATIAGLRNLKEILNKPINEMSAKDGMVIDLGGISLKIIITPNLNWPDTMMIYIEEKQILLSGTMFVRYGYEKSAEEYFVCELSQFSDFVRSAIERVKTFPIKTIYPSEGYSSDMYIVDLYEWFISENKKKSGTNAAIIYAGKENGYTAELVKVVEQTIRARDISVESISCERNRSDAIKALNSADILCFASPTINRKAVPAIMDVITMVDRVNRLRTPCIVIGSYGWGGEALGFMANYLKMMKMSVFEKPFGVVFKPSDKDKEELRKFTERFIDEALQEE